MQLVRQHTFGALVALFAAALARGEGLDRKGLAKQAEMLSAMGQAHAAAMAGGKPSPFSEMPSLPDLAPPPSIEAVPSSKSTSTLPALAPIEDSAPLLVPPAPASARPAPPPAPVSGQVRDPYALAAEMRQYRESKKAEASPPADSASSTSGGGSTPVSSSGASSSSPSTAFAFAEPAGSNAKPETGAAWASGAYLAPPLAGDRPGVGGNAFPSSSPSGKEPPAASRLAFTGDPTTVVSALPSSPTAPELSDPSAEDALALLRSSLVTGRKRPLTRARSRRYGSETSGKVAPTGKAPRGGTR